jgi:hypothetical protein
MDLSHDDALLLAFHAPLSAPPTISRHLANRPDQEGLLKHRVHLSGEHDRRRFVRPDGVSAVNNLKDEEEK